VDRRQFVKAAALAGAGGAYFGAAHLFLGDERWTPNRSYWVSRGRAPASEPLRGVAEADVGIIGAGVTGLSTAIHLLRRSPGARVAVLEARYAGYGATGRSGGVIGPGTEMGTPPGTSDNSELVLALIDQFGIECDLERERPRLDPYRYAVGLKRAAEGLGATVYEGTRVRSIRRGAPVEVAGDGFSLRVQRLVLATNGYTPRLGVAAERIFPAHTGAAVTAPLPSEVLGALPDEIHVMTSGEMYMWGRKAPEGRLLVGAGAKYFYGDGLYHSGERFLFSALRRVLEREFPALRPYAFEHAWTGPMGCTVDQEPVIGRLGAGGNVLYCGGYTGHGLAMGTKCGSFLAGALEGEEPPSWLLRPTTPLPPEPLRYIALNSVIHLMNLGIYRMAKHG
jgi:glycine/D-amino acid oxidase-like deaminating enzyme